MTSFILYMCIFCKYIATWYSCNVIYSGNTKTNRNEIKMWMKEVVGKPKPSRLLRAWLLRQWQLIPHYCLFYFIGDREKNTGKITNTGFNELPIARSKFCGPMEEKRIWIFKLNVEFLSHLATTLSSYKSERCSVGKQVEACDRWIGEASLCQKC